jgi:hypothetical protein
MAKVKIELKRPISFGMGNLFKALKPGVHEVEDSCLGAWYIDSLIASGDLVILGSVVEPVAPGEEADVVIEATETESETTEDSSDKAPTDDNEGSTDDKVGSTDDKVEPVKTSKLRRSSKASA